MNLEKYKFDKKMIKAGSDEEKILLELDHQRIPEHIAIIMDGNGRWAKKRGMPRVFGHREGVKSVRNILESCARLGCKVLTIYAFSVENWKRPKAEVDALMSMLSEYLKKEVKNLVANGIRFLPLGRWQQLPEKTVEDIKFAMDATKEGEEMLFQVALNYGGRSEIVDACRAIVESGMKSRDIDEETFAKYLYTPGIPDPDIMIRTSGEMRVSNFLLWEIAYSELYITEEYWPEFRLLNLLKAVKEYQGRDRRFGGLKEDSK